MSTAIILPSPLRTQLAMLHRRATLLRAVRRLAVLVLVLVLSAAAAVLADGWLELTPLTRQVLFSIWLAAGIGWLLLGVVVPLGRRFDAAALAAVIEEKYPELAERLTSAVELADSPDERNGSPLLIALLLEETANRSARLDFRPALPARRAGSAALLAAVVVLAAIAPAFVWPQTTNAQLNRFFRPWSVAPVPPPYDVAVSPGDAVAALGRVINLSAHLTPRNDNVVLPENATLLVVENNGKETRHAMQRGENGDFTYAYKLPGDVTYHIEAGDVVSDSHHLTAVTPVELAADSPLLIVTPPAYARNAKEAETFHGLVDLSPLQHSALGFAFCFTRPAKSAYLEWSAPDEKGKSASAAEQTIRYPLLLGEDRRTATLSIPAKKDGNYRLILEAEHGIRTELQGGSVRVQPDQPPTVSKFTGKEEQRLVQASERIPLEIEAADDVGVAGIELEYRINDGESVRQALDLQGGNTPAASAQHVLELAGKVRSDDRVRYRFHVRDNLPKEYQGPHVIVYPSDRWLTLRIARPGSPARQQEILAQRDDLRRRLNAIRLAILQERRGVYKVRQETRGEAKLPPDQLDNLKELQEANRSSEKGLREAAEIAEAEPALQPIAETARTVADQEMHRSEKALADAARPETPVERTRRFDDADRQLDSALRRLEELAKTNNRIAQERLDQARLEALAEREKRLAEEAAELAAKHPVLDPKARELAEKIKREQEQVAQELDRLGQESEPLKQALEQARQEQARQLSERAREMAQAQRELMRAEAESARQSQADRLAELARRQQELAKREAKLAEQTRPSTPVAQTQPLKTEEAERAAEALKQGNAPEAVRHQEQSAQELDRLAQAYEQAVRLSTDPREAARQLERAETDLRRRLSEEIGKRNSKEPLPERLQPLRKEQEAIRQAAQQLSVPPQHNEANQLKRQIAERTAEALDALKKQDAPRAQGRMEETRNLLHRLADALPNGEQRRQQARREAERLRRQQEAIAREVEQIKKDDPSAPQRLADAARRQAETAEAVSKMDAPNQEQRRERTTEALNRALADLLDGRRDDLAASQQEAKRQLERLEQALRGEKPADERARELARQQRELAEAARAAAEGKTTPQQQHELQNKQRQLADQTRGLPAAEAPQRQREAAEAAERAAQAAQAQPASPETRKQMEEAARKLDDLARQLAGEESDAERAERLARRQAENAAEAERRPGQSATAEMQRKQQEIAREAREVRGGEEGQREKQRAQAALERAQRAAAKEEAAAQRQAADALRDLADRLAGRDTAAAKANALARRQRELADEAAKAEASKDGAAQARQAAAQQADLRRQVERLNDKEAAKETAEKMQQATQALEKAKTPAEAKDVLARAAESAEKMAEQFGKAQTAKQPAASPERTTSAKPAQSPREQAKQMAQQQRQLAQASEKAGKASGGHGGKAMQDVARQQHELNQQASRLPANQAQRGLEQARAAMNRAEQALARNDAAKAQQKQNEAAQALERLAAQLPAQAQPSTPTNPQAAPSSLPSKEQSEQARRLAREQRELRDAVQRATQAAVNERPVVRDNPVAELARQQADVAKHAAELARGVAAEQGEKASVAQQARQAQQAAQQAAQRMQAGALPQARQAGQQSAEQLRQLTAQLARTPRGEASPADTLHQARQLERRQEEINRRLQPLAGDARVQAAQQQAEQRHLQKEAGELQQQFQRLTQQARTSRPMQSALQQAAGNTQQAQQAMQQAREQGQRGQSSAEQQSQERAAGALERAAQAAENAARQGQQTAAQSASSKSSSSKSGEAVAQASRQMADAQGQLQQGRPTQAQSAMKQAAEALGQAAKQMDSRQQQTGQPSKTSSRGRQAGGEPDLREYGLDKTPYAGKRWGELPGELRTKIVQDMKARYGDDYARMIKYYFEHAADTTAK